MDSITTLQSILTSVAKDMEQELVLELDRYSRPSHRFTRRYDKQKKRMITQYSKRDRLFRKCLLFIFVSIFVLLTCFKGYQELRMPWATLIKYLLKEDFFL